MLGWKIPKSSSSDELQKAAKKIRDPKDDEAALVICFVLLIYLIFIKID